MHRTSLVIIGLCCLTLFVTPGCESEPTKAAPVVVPPGPITWDDAELRILFVGNSLTYANNLPGLVEMIANEAGMSVSTQSIAYGNYSLEDHWAAGLETKISDASPDLVVMQQGPSSLAQNQVHLRTWAGIISRAIRAAEAEPAMFMVWPSLAREFAFPDVLNSYRTAATTINGRFFPAGEAFRQSFADHNLGPYGPDNFHPSRFGSIISALTIVRTLKPDLLENLPGEIISEDPAVPSMELNERKDLVFSIVDAVVEEHGF